MTHLRSIVLLQLLEVVVVVGRLEHAFNVSCVEKWGTWLIIAIIGFIRLTKALAIDPLLLHRRMSACLGKGLPFRLGCHRL